RRGCRGGPRGAGRGGKRHAVRSGPPRARRRRCRRRQARGSGSVLQGGRCDRDGRARRRERRADDPVRGGLREGGGPRGAPHHGGLEGVGGVKRFDVVTIFPEMLDALADSGITRRALDEKRFELHVWDPRDYATDSYRRVDDGPYGGGPGMVMMAEPVQAAIDAARERQRAAGVERPRVVLMSPQRERVDEKLVNALAGEDGLVIIAGRYEGVDERVIERSV